MPSLDIPLRVDEQGNGLLGLGQPASDTYAELRRRTKHKPSTVSSVLRAQPTLPAGGVNDVASVGNSHTSFLSGSLTSAPALTTVIGSLSGPSKTLPPVAMCQNAYSTTNTADLLTGDPDADALVRQLHDLEMSFTQTNNPWTPMSSDHSFSFASTMDLMTALRRALGEEPLKLAASDSVSTTILQIGFEQEPPSAPYSHTDDPVGTAAERPVNPPQEPRKSQRLSPGRQKPSRNS